MAQNSTGMSILFSSGFLAEIKDCTPFTSERPALNTSHMLSTNAHTFIPGDLVDWGSFDCTINFDATTTPPTNDDPETFTITWADGSTFSCSGFMTNYSVTANLETVMEASVTVKLSGEPDFVASS